MMRVTVSICTRRFENLTPSLLEPWGRYPAYMTYMVTHTDDINFTKKNVCINFGQHPILCFNHKRQV